MEDSGIDSEDRQSTVFEDITMPHKSLHYTDVANKHMEELEVTFRGASDPNAHLSSSKSNASTTATSQDSEEGSTVISKQPPSTCRILQRKLELKVERAKRNYSQYQEEKSKKTQTSSLIPISRLPIPGDTEKKPLVDYNSDSSNDPDDLPFFPANLRKARRHRQSELTDTFSIQEMTIDSDLDSDDSGSQNLELLPPTMKSNLLQKLQSCFRCQYGS